VAGDVLEAVVVLACTSVFWRARLNRE